MAEAEIRAYSNFDLRADTPAAQQPTVRFAFEFPELFGAFESIDRTANKARRGSRTMGFWAIGLVLTALLLASAGPAVDYLGPEAHEAAGYTAAGLGLAGTLLGLWSRTGLAPRARWLRARFRAETLRLFHFLYLADRLPEAVRSSGDASAEQTYVAKRSEVFAQLKHRLLDRRSKAYAKLLSDAEPAPLGGLIDLAPAGDLELSAAAKDAFEAWRRLRLDAQLEYCNAKLASKGVRGHSTPKRQEEAFAFIGWFCIAAIVVLHILHFAESLTHLPALWLQIGIVWIALFALAARALESGLAPQREVERYQQYRVNIRVAIGRFEAAQSFAAKMETMRAFERASLEEMIVFIRTHAKSHFLL